ncbi:amidase family protein [Bailinhaonella thermotolerans]|uniref:Amidase domain-containing protein n=1 Tax=Bailinhaonella thermotolerans TaxID=1070861 RepID=A0A3A4BCZ5_9ACTN|nr:amidase family protein [Bailinhaonella thermotolerans]RJL35976.1 hypothetical protein D5H75_04220 [Bailinhaonella thermotolerans]
MVGLELLGAPAHRMLRALAAREVGCRELIESCLRRIEAVNPRLNAVVALDGDRAVEEAARADRALARGEGLGPLHGLPITVKDSIETEGLPATCGLRGLAGHRPAADAPAVARLRAAGAIVLGKTNTCPLEQDAVTDNPVYGLTVNPWDPGRTPGGSSGGSAAAVAAGLSALDLAADDAGSIRIPASYCGVSGHKPTYRLIPVLGHIPPMPGDLREPDLGVLGPIARSARDLDLALGVLAGPGPADAVAWRLALPPPPDRPLRVACWFDDPAAPIDDEVRRCLERAAGALADAGARVRPVDAPVGGLAEYERLYNVLGLSPHNHLLPERDYESLLALREDDGPLGVYARGVTASTREWNLADEERARLRARWAEFFRSFDVLLTPATQTAAFPHPPPGERRLLVNGESRPFSVAWTVVAGLCHLPATVTPAGRTSGNLPAGIQIIAPYLRDRTALATAALLEARLPPPPPPPLPGGGVDHGGGSPPPG